MRDLPIAYGNSCMAKFWSNKMTTFDDLCERLSHTVRTTETVEEYPKMRKEDRDRAKDKGGFVYWEWISLGPFFFYAYEGGVFTSLNQQTTSRWLMKRLSFLMYV